MKKLIFLLIAVIALSNCSAQTTNNKLNIKKREKITNNRKFDIEEYRKVIKEESICRSKCFVLIKMVW